ncbi:MAG: hypothetical protein K6G61_03245 [Solobacterium sp.]|nr:hypothetical protein [Solobacterium sp.]
MKKYTNTALASVLAASLLAGCSSSTPASSAAASSAGSAGSAGSEAAPASSAAETTPSGDQILKFGLSGFEGVFNPILSDNVYDSYCTSLMFDGLVDVDSTGNYVPELATWELSDDHLTYTFTMIDGPTFSNGSPVTTDDVAFTYNTIKEEDYAGPRTNVGAAIASIEVIDDKTIAFTMTDPSPANLQNFTYGILDDEYYAHSSFEELAAKNNEPMGCGIVTFDGWAAKQYVNMVKNDTYYGDQLKIDGIQFLHVEEDGILGALQNGEIDFCQPAAKAENVEAVDGMDNSHLVSYLANGYTFMCFNTTRAHTAEIPVRQALLYALDRKNFLTAEYGSEELVSLGMAPISKTSWAYPGDDELNAYDFDLEKAAALLDEAGWTLNESTGIREKDVNGDGEIKAEDYETMELNWLVYYDATWPGTLSGMAFDSWGQIGVKLNISTMDFNTVASETMDAKPGEKDFDIYTMGFSLSVDPDPTGGLFDADAYSEGGFNASGWRNDHAQELMKAGLTEFDQAKRAEIYKEWAIIQNEEVPTAIVAYRSEIWGINNRVHGLDDIGVYTDFTEIIQNVTLD